MNEVFRYRETDIMVKNSDNRIAPFRSYVLRDDEDTYRVSGNYVSSARALFAAIKYIDGKLLWWEVEQRR